VSSQRTRPSTGAPSANLRCPAPSCLRTTCTHTRNRCAFGHQFSTRSGHGRACDGGGSAASASDSASPVFPLFLDCVWQLLRQVGLVYTHVSNPHALRCEYVSIHVHAKKSALKFLPTLRRLRVAAAAPGVTMRACEHTHTEACSAGRWRCARAQRMSHVHLITCTRVPCTNGLHGTRRYANAAPLGASC
jgi:Myotubularin-like phosphatase domain